MQSFKSYLLVLLSSVACQQPSITANGVIREEGGTCAASVWNGTISVVGYGTVSVPSDMATISLSIEGSAPTVNEARNLVAESSQKVSTALQKLLPPENIYPLSVTIVPEQREVRTDDGDIMIIIDGYKYSNSMDIEIENVTSRNIAFVLDQAAAEGQQSVSIQRIAFSLSSEVHLQASKLAREIAIEDAFAKAQEYAREINSTLGPIKSLSEFPPYGSSASSITSLPASQPATLPGYEMGWNTISRNEFTATIYVDFQSCLTEFGR